MELKNQDKFICHLRNNNKSIILDRDLKSHPLKLNLTEKSLLNTTKNNKTTKIFDDSYNTDYRQQRKKLFTKENENKKHYTEIKPSIKLKNEIEKEYKIRVQKVSKYEQFYNEPAVKISNNKYNSLYKTIDYNIKDEIKPNYNPKVLPHHKKNISFDLNTTKENKLFSYLSKPNDQKITNSKLILEYNLISKPKNESKKIFKKGISQISDNKQGFYLN